MADSNPDEVQATTRFCALCDTQGRQVLLPAVTVDHLRAQGFSSITLTIQLDPPRPPKPWLTVTEAARLHLCDVDGMTLTRAKADIVHACNDGRLRCEGSRSRRRIESTSFDAWRLARCEKDLDRRA